MLMYLTALKGELNSTHISTTLHAQQLHNYYGTACCSHSTFQLLSEQVSLVFGAASL
jgi:hypothetical protein